MAASNPLFYSLIRALWTITRCFCGVLVLDDEMFHHHTLYCKARMFFARLRKQQKGFFEVAFMCQTVEQRLSWSEALLLDVSAVFLIHAWFPSVSSVSVRLITLQYLTHKIWPGVNVWNCDKCFAYLKTFKGDLLCLRLRSRIACSHNHRMMICKILKNLI